MNVSIFIRILGMLSSRLSKKKYLNMNRNSLLGKVKTKTVEEFSLCSKVVIAQQNRILNNYQFSTKHIKFV